MLLAAALIGIPVAAASGATSVQMTMESSLDSTVLKDINAYRQSNGLQPLRLNPKLSAAAATHTREMAAGGYFSHDSADGSAFWKRVQRFYGSAGYHFWSVGENLVYGSPDLSDQDVMDEWIQSPEHKANLLNPSWKEVGISAAHIPDAPGDYDNSETTIVTADFGVRRK